MMSQSAFVFYYWFMFIWGAVGLIFIAVAVIRELGIQIKLLKENNRINFKNEHKNL